MGTRIGAFKTKNTQLVIWQNDRGISFTFAKHYKDKQTGEWKKTETIYAEELHELADMFTRANQWAENKKLFEKRPQDNISRVDDVIMDLINKLKE